MSCFKTNIVCDKLRGIYYCSVAVTGAVSELLRGFRESRNSAGLERNRRFYHVNDIYQLQLLSNENNIEIYEWNCNIL